LGQAPDWLCLPVGNAGNITAYWKGFREYHEKGRSPNLPHVLGVQAEGSAPLVLGHPVDKPETVATAIRIGRPARITGPEGDLAGRVTVVSPAVNANTTTVEVWVELENPGERLKPGASVRVSIIAETLQNIIVVPAVALLNSDEGGQKVMVITKDSVAHERKISVGVRQGDRVQIASGLQKGDQVVTSGGLGLEDKAKVVVQQPKAEEEEEDKDDEKK
jgi:multidrug efflux pump subunit AcrA (membrane-fusion protein)